ncbi:intracellular protein transport protein USO1-like isoform X2 [Trichoplusia ni]|uniref:Intracellular protein transport protein USO1-like isoform X2 n=1 Tax=Trichoplusia ni TaxID=7111 RepID=A0A7E5W5A3_TRINI|nr:intracellular protein transport protein USO1-like isoform X2 [Trichoplusia ni]
MDGPGMSLFQGAASIHLNNSAQDRLEEQEELEDQKRRNEELKHKLANAFDDLLDDDEASSVNSSGNYTLDPAQSNGIPQTRTGLPPTYVESLNHLKENQHCSDSPKYCETPKNHTAHLRHQEDALKTQFSPYGAGDGQNHYFQQDYRGHVNGINNCDRQEFMNNEQLKVMYDIRVKECTQLAGQMQKLDTEIDSLRARLAGAINDRDKAELSLQEAHHLLASSKHKLLELEQQIANLTEKLLESDQEKEQLKLELRSANISLQDVQQRLHTLQVAHTHDTDAIFREQQDRHREEMERLQNDLSKAKSRLDEKENEVKILERRCMEKDREKSDILIEKGATINRLASELEAAQSRLGNGETTRLKEKVSQLTTERNAAREQVKELGSKLELTAHELVLYRNKLTASQKEYENWRTTLHQILIEALPENTYIGEPPSPGKLATLKEVLSRYKLQMQKLSSLQEEINKRDKKIELHRKQESELRSKLEEQKGLEMQLNSRMAVLQNKLELLGSNSDSELLESYKQQNESLQAELEELDLKYTQLELDYEKLKTEKGSRASIVQEANADLLRELERYSGQLKDTLKENGELKTLYLQACSSRDSVSRELKDMQSKIQKEKELYKSQEKDYVERLEKQKQQMEKLTADLSSSKEELERANKRISELQKEFTNKQREFTEKLDKYLEDEKCAMRKDREPCTQCEKHVKHIKYLDDQLGKCTIKIASQESNDALMQELKGKAEFFQQYILERFNKLQEQRSVATNTEPAPDPAEPHSSIEQLVQTCDDAMAAKTALMMKEKVIRDQIAEKFTLEMKTVEMNCARRIKEIENEHIETVTKLKELLERKAKEVDALKEFILAERAKVTQILEAKENEISELIKEHNALQVECQKAKDSVVDWKQKAERYKERASRLGSLEDVLKHEREDWKQRNSSSTKECLAMKAKASELQSKLAQLEQKYEKLQAEQKAIYDKYKNAKKTIYTYKDYVTKKDAHVNNEMNRIQDEYRKIFLKLQSQLNYHINCRLQEERKGKQAQGYSQQTDYTDRINKLNDDFTRLTQSNFMDGPDMK